MKRFFLDFFSYNRRERNGVLILLAIILIVILYLNFSYLFYTPEKTDFTLFEQQLKALTDSTKEKTDSSVNNTHYSTTDNYKKTTGTKGERFNFNPNNLPEEDWKRLGLTDKQIKVIKNYEAKGGQFRRKEDVKKMYCIREEMYVSLEPYILIPDKKLDNTNNKYFKKDSVKPNVQQPIYNIFPVELNSADSLTLIKIKGIKGFYAKKIIERRNELGGFYRKEQLMELWKFDKEKYDGVDKYVTVNSSLVKKININTCTAKELKHPYLSWNLVNGIISYRTKHGKYLKVEDILKTDLVDDETYRKIVSYLTIE